MNTFTKIITFSILYCQYRPTKSQLNLLQSQQIQTNVDQSEQIQEQSQTQNLGFSNDHLYQVKSQDQEVLTRQKRLKNVGFDSCIDDTSIMQYLSQFEEVGSGAFGSVIVASVNDQSQDKYAFKVQQYQKDQDDIYKSEVQISIVLRQLQIQNPNLKVPIYYGCYTGSINNKYYLILQYQVLGSELDLYFGDDIDELGNDPRPYLNYSKETRLKNFEYLFETLNILHQNNIILRDIKPANIMTEVNLKNVSATNQPPNSLYFIDFGFALQNKTTGPLAGTPSYIHPSVFISTIRGNQIDKLNDVFALCYSYFIIEDYATFQLIGDDIKGMDFKLKTDLSQNDLYKQNNPKILNQIKNIKLLVYKYFLDKNKFPDINTINSDIDQCIQQNVDLDTKASNLVEICKKDKECIIYAGFQNRQRDTPSAELLLKALKIANENRLRNL